MEDKDVEYLESCVKAGLQVWWCNNQGDWHLCGNISHNHHDEPGAVIFIKDYKLGTSYLPLDHCETKEFIVTSPDLAKWPSKIEKTKNERISDHAK